MIRERPDPADSRYLADDGTWRSGPRPVPLSSADQFELKVEMNRFVVTRLDSITLVPPRLEDWPEEKPWPPPRPPEPKQKRDIAAEHHRRTLLGNPDNLSFHHVRYQHI